MTNEESEVRDEEKLNSTIEPAVTTIEELRKTPAPLAKMPIVLNNYKPDKTAVSSTEAKAESAQLSHPKLI